MSDPEKQLELYEKLHDNAQKQIDRVWKAYAILAGLLGVGAVLIFGSIGSFRQSLRDEYKLEMQSAQRELRAQVQRAFAEDNIKALVEGEAQLRIDAIADTLISNQIDRAIQAHVADLREKIEHIDLGGAKLWFDGTNLNISTPDAPNKESEAMR